MRIKSLVLDNFQGFGHFELNACGNNTSVIGDNGTGKTTIANAWCWLLFNRPVDLTTGWLPKPFDENGNPIHELESTVTATIELDNSSIVELKKTLFEKWSKPRGTDKKIFGGNGINYSINSVPKKEKEFNAYLQDTFGSNLEIMLMTLPNFFALDSKENKWDWKARRNLLIDMIGEITDQEVIQSNSELQELNTVLSIPGNASNFYAIEEYQAIAKAEKSKFQKQIDSYPIRIQENQMTINSLNVDDPIEFLQEKKAEINHKISIKNDEIQRIKSQSVSQAKQSALNELKLEEQQARINHATDDLRFNSDLKLRINNLENEKNATERNIDFAKSSLTSMQSRLLEMQNGAKSLKEQIAQVNERAFDMSQNVCPVCGQEYPTEKMNEMLEQFNLQKSNELEKLQAKGKELYSKEQFAKVKADIEQYKLDINQYSIKLGEICESIANLKGQYKIIIPFESSSKWQEIKEKREEIENKFVDNTVERITPIQLEIHRLEDEVSEINRDILKIQQIEQLNARIESLKQEQKRDVANYSLLEKGLYLCQLFVMTKVNMINDSINKHFRNIKFVMFEENTSNDGIKECCKVYIPTKQGLVPYETANRASQINAGLEIISILQSKFKKSMPVFVDNAESVTKLNRFDYQIIRLVVSGYGDKLQILED